MGLTTSIAVFLHELPHELADYAILCYSGFSSLKAAMLNAMSNGTAYLGAVVGILVTTASPNEEALKGTRETIFGLAAGMFIYIAVADLLPTLKEGLSVSDFSGYCAGKEGEKDNTNSLNGDDGTVQEAEGDVLCVDVVDGAEVCVSTDVDGEGGDPSKRQATCVHEIHPFSWKRIVAQHVGMLMGWAIMLLITVIEERLEG
ncbi:hypothetical protein HDV05_006187 [Chytridiales sp. JEL 0842]|nr:hypothetical protein HDV05_006187 [Chytridiales sp. JEL 0842]